jgi:2-oxoglutarate ferredoxin oxidoreductase subunit beta
MSPVALQELKQYQGNVKPVWCPGCGDFSVLTAMYQALAELKLDPSKVVIASGIGCSGRFPAYVNGYGFHGIHGRVLPTASGIKIANPNLTVLAVGGDGDGLAIGGGHFPHACRRNVDMTYVMLDNQIYGLTKGQPSPTTMPSLVKYTKEHQPYGIIEDRINPVRMALAYGATFVARGYSGKVSQILDLIKRGIQHKGFSFIHVLSPCVTFYPTYEFFRQATVPIPEAHDPGDQLEAVHMAQTPGKFYLGVFYQHEGPDFTERMELIKQKAGTTTLNEIAQGYI